MSVAAPGMRATLGQVAGFQTGLVVWRYCALHLSVLYRSLPSKPVDENGIRGFASERVAISAPPGGLDLRNCINALRVVEMSTCVVDKNHTMEDFPSVEPTLG